MIDGKLQVKDLKELLKSQDDDLFLAFNDNEWGDILISHTDVRDVFKGREAGRAVHVKALCFLE